MNRRASVVSRKAVGRSVDKVLRRRTRKAPKLGAEVKPQIRAMTDPSMVVDMLKSSPGTMHFREGEYLHVSDLVGKCMRKIALSIRTGVSMPSEPLFDSLGITFAQGNAIHEYVRDRAAIVSSEYLYGNWHCLCKTEQFMGTHRESRKKPKCEKCGTGLDTYDELVVKNEDVKVTGAVDMPFLINDYFYLSEIKSISKGQWDVLNRAKPDHVIQVLMYWWLMKEAGYKLYDQISVLYAVKEYVFKNPYKEFVITPSEHIHRLEDYLQEARELKVSREGGDLPKRTSCPKENCPTAKKCNLSTVCFTME